MQPASTPLIGMIRWLKSPPVSPEPVGHETWPAMIARICEPSRVHEIDEPIYRYFLEVLPPLWIGDSGFAFADGDEPLRLFWRDAESSGFRVRQLTSREHATFCALAGLPPTYRFRTPADCPNCG